MNDYTDHEIALVMSNYDCTREEAVETLDDASNLDEKLMAMGLATEQGGDIVRNANWREEL